MPDLGKKYFSIIEMKIQEIEIFRRFISNRKESDGRNMKDKYFFGGLIAGAIVGVLIRLIMKATGIV